MKSFNTIISNIARNFKAEPARNIEDIQRLRAAKRRRIRIRSELQDVFLMLLGVLSAGFGLKSFLIPSGFIDGGVTGISLLINHETSIPLALLIITINLPFILLGYKQIGKVFSLKSIFAISLLALAVAFIPYPAITKDPLLVAVFGGFFLGGGIGATIRGGGVIDGTEILALFINRRSSLTVGDIILLFNIVIFSAAAYLLTIEVALYAILTYMSASKTVDFILEGIEEFTGVTIISNRSKQISDMIQNHLGRGMTIYQGKKGFGKRGENLYSTDIIFTVITRLEINRLTTEVERIDPHAFIVMQSIKDTRGGMVKKMPLKE